MANFYEVNGSNWVFISALSRTIPLYKRYFGDTANLVVNIGSGRNGESIARLKDELSASNAVNFVANPAQVGVIEEATPGVTTIQAAIKDVAEETTFLQVQSDYQDLRGASTFYHYQLDRDRPEFYYHFSSATIVPISVTTTTAAIALADAGFADTDVDFLRIMTNGWSYQVLDGLGDKLDNVKAVQMQTEKFKAHPDHKSSALIADFMHAKGFALVDTGSEWGTPFQDQFWINTAKITTEEAVTDLYPASVQAD